LQIDGTGWPLRAAVTVVSPLLTVPAGPGQRDRITIAGYVRSKDMAESTITVKGQTMVPVDIRAPVDAKPGTRLAWSAMLDGTIIVRAKTKSILDMAGMLKAPKGRHVSVHDMTPWR
jgi:bifunctional DNA-binding transcriptional regulator/antitoxin component of YhaV-PrlF toxin-antitoxin module